MLWLACHDTDAANSEAAQRLVEAANVDFPQDFVRPLADQLPHDNADIRQAAALALAHGIKARLPHRSAQSSSCHWLLNHQHIDLMNPVLVTTLPSQIQ